MRRFRCVFSCESAFAGYFTVNLKMAPSALNPVSGLPGSQVIKGGGIAKKKDEELIEIADMTEARFLAVCGKKAILIRHCLKNRNVP